MFVRFTGVGHPTLSMAGPRANRKQEGMLRLQLSFSVFKLNLGRSEGRAGREGVKLWGFGMGPVGEGSYVAPGRIGSLVCSHSNERSKST